MTSPTLQEALTFLAAPFLMCIVLAGIHCYLGLHVLARGVIFVDLSLAQVAGFGATVALLLGFEHDSTASYFIALGATFVAAALFSRARRFEGVFPQEAVIGVTYALASAAVVLVVNRMAHGAEHVKDLLVGQLLWVTWSDLLKTTLIYSAVSAVHFIFRKKLMQASFQNGSGSTLPFWDFVFYALFGIIITSSVHLAGVLQVFAYLVVPAMISSAFFKRLRTRLIFGWALGIAVSALGMGLSYRYDLPAGAVIVVCLGLMPLILIFLPRKVLRGRNPQAR